MAIKKSRILVVGGKDKEVRLIQAQLSELGYDPVGHASGNEEAIHLAGNLSADLVLRLMPEGPAPEILATAQSFLADFHLPVVFLMASGVEDVFVRTNLGATFDYVIEPFKERELRTAIEMALYKNQVEARLRLSEVALRATSQGVIICDADQRILSANDAFLTITGYNENEILNRSCEFLFGAGTDPKLVSSLRLALKNAQAFSGELVSYRKDGSTYWNELTITPVRDERGRLTHHIGGILDITTRKKTEEELIASEGRYHRLFDLNPQPMWVYDMETLHFLAVNDAAMAHYGYSRDEFLAITVPDVIPPEEQPGFGIATSATGDLPGVGRHKLKDGTIIDVEISSSALRFFQRQARMVLAKDITERLLAERKYLEQATLLDKARDAIIVRDLENRILYWNQSAERLYGWKVADVMGRSMLSNIYRELPAFQSAMEVVLSKGEWRGEIEQWTADGKLLLVEGLWTLVRDEEGLPKSIFSINTDITARKKLEQQYFRAQRMESIGTLAGGIAHDLNNVLAPILMSVGLLKRYVSDPKGLKFIDRIGSSAQRGANLVSQVLLFARGVEGQPVEVESRDLILDLVKIVEETFPKNVLIKTRLDLDLWVLEVDPTQLHQVILNLCVNARDAMPAGGVLTIRASNLHIDAHYAAMNIEAQVGKYVLLEVEDTGTGMSKEIIANIFDPFYTTKEVGKRTGLGLATSMTIVKGHGGFVEVNSEPGMGSRFCVYLPARTEEASGVESGQDLQLPRGNGETILVVDDEASVRLVTQQTLEAFGYNVLLASDGVEAVSSYVEHRREISVVLTDMMMPIIDGPTMANILRRMDPGVRIIGASGLATQKLKAKAIQAGVSRFIPKPYTAETLLTALSMILSEETATKPFKLPQGAEAE